MTKFSSLMKCYNLLFPSTMMNVYNRTVLYSLRNRFISSACAPILDSIASVGLLRYRGTRGGRNKCRKIPVLARTSSSFTPSLKMESAIRPRSLAPVSTATSLTPLLRMGYLNARSINNKPTEIKSLIPDNNLSVLALCETWQEETDSLALRRCTPPGYVAFGVPRPQKKTTSKRLQTGGGVAVITHRPHVIYSLPPDIKIGCGNTHGMWESYQQLHFDQFLRNIKIMKPQQVDLSEQMHHLRIAFIVDHTLFLRLNSSLEQVVHYIGLLSNLVDDLLRGLRINIELVYIEIWNDHDVIPLSTNIRQSLISFLAYRLHYNVDCDYAHLLTGKLFEGNELGMSIEDSICTARSLAISQVNNPKDILQAANGIVHMIGHVLGISHDNTEECMCQRTSKENRNSACIMQADIRGHFEPHSGLWSVCSSKSIRQAVLSRLVQCLLPTTNNETSYEQLCGNGKIERGEECDCVDPECDYLEPCCDTHTCLLKPWATCRNGDCCLNCTVLPDNQMCRAASGECDVPEFCDGHSGQCPENRFVQDGQECPAEKGAYCYRGVCQTYGRQCREIWGPKAEPSDDKCYEMFNTAGRFDGHCGIDVRTGEYIKCTNMDKGCGLLHCTNGSEHPLLANWTYSVTSVVSHGNVVQCKVLVSNQNEFNNGGYSMGDHASILFKSTQIPMVNDGTHCSSDSLCLSGQCVPVTHVMPATCPLGPNRKICSDKGVCTTDLKCFCQPTYSGVNCSERKNHTSLSLLTTAPPILPTLFPLSLNITVQMATGLPFYPGLGHTVSLDSINSLKPISSFFVTSVPKVSNEGSTMVLIIVLAIVVSVAFILLLCCIFCYKNSNIRPSKGLYKTSELDRKRNSYFLSQASHNFDDIDVAANKNRIISFGNTPSYRADKIRKALRAAVASETESDKSGRDRNSAELHESAAVALSMVPERGILKKCSSKVKNNQKNASKLVDVDQAMTIGNVQNVVVHVDVKSELDRLTASRQNGTKLENGLFSPVLFEDSDDNSSCSCSCEDGNELGQLNETGVKTHSMWAGQRVSGEKETQTDAPSYIRPVENFKKYISTEPLLDELQHQIDEQFLPTLHQTGRQPGTLLSNLSPSLSDDHSETEADRCLPPNSFYHQTNLSSNSTYEPKLTDTAEIQSTHTSSSKVFKYKNQSPVQQSRNISHRDSTRRAQNSIEMQRRMFFENQLMLPDNNLHQQSIGITSSNQVNNETPGLPHIQPNQWPLIGPKPWSSRIISGNNKLSLPNNQLHIDTSQRPVVPDIFHPSSTSSTRFPVISTFPLSLFNTGPGTMVHSSTAAKPCSDSTVARTHLTTVHLSNDVPVIDDTDNARYVTALSLPAKEVSGCLVDKPCYSQESHHLPSTISNISPPENLALAKSYKINQGISLQNDASGITIGVYLPKKGSFESKFIPDSKGAYTKAPGSPGSPDDLDV